MECVASVTAYYRKVGETEYKTMTKPNQVYNVSVDGSNANLAHFTLDGTFDVDETTLEESTVYESYVEISTVLTYVTADGKIGKTVRKSSNKDNPVELGYKAAPVTVIENATGGTITNLKTTTYNTVKFKDSFDITNYSQYTNVEPVANVTVTLNPTGSETEENKIVTTVENVPYKVTIDGSDANVAHCTVSGTVEVDETVLTKNTDYDTTVKIDTTIHCTSADGRDREITKTTESATMQLTYKYEPEIKYKNEKTKVYNQGMFGPVIDDDGVVIYGSLDNLNTITFTDEFYVTNGNEFKTGGFKGVANIDIMYCKLGDSEYSTITLPPKSYEVDSTNGITFNFALTDTVEIDTALLQTESTYFVYINIATEIHYTTDAGKDGTSIRHVTTKDYTYPGSTKVMIQQLTYDGIPSIILNKDRLNITKNTESNKFDVDIRYIIPNYFAFKSVTHEPDSTYPCLITRFEDTDFNVFCEVYIPCPFEFSIEGSGTERYGVMSYTGTITIDNTLLQTHFFSKWDSGNIMKLYYIDRVQIGTNLRVTTHLGKSVMTMISGPSLYIDDFKVDINIVRI